MKFILTIILIIIVLGWLRRFLYFGAAKAIQKAAEDMMKKQQEANQMNRKPEGSVTVEDFGKSKGNKIPPGEYTDYDEVK